MNLPKLKNSSLANILTAAMISVVVGATVTGCAATAAQNDKQNQHMMPKNHHGDKRNFEQHLQRMQANAQAAASAPISASQAVSIVQQQTANARILGVRYHDGSNRPNKANIANNANDNIVGYHVMAIGADGKPQLYIVNATNGQVSQQAMPERAMPKQADSADRQRPTLPTTSVSLERAMQLAANKVGGEAIGAHLGGRMGGGHPHGERGGKHGGERDGKRDMKPQDGTQFAQSMPAQPQPPKTPSYDIEVVKGQDVYKVKVDAQTGAVSDPKSVKDMPNRSMPN